MSFGFFNKKKTYAYDDYYSQDYDSYDYDFSEELFPGEMSLEDEYEDYDY